MFDDPVQAMDDAHHESFLQTVVPSLLDDYGLQVLVLTHIQNTADRLRELNYGRNPTYYRLDTLAADGPKISEYVVLRDELKHIRALAQGPQTDRNLAVDRLRVACEYVIREAHMKFAGASIPVGKKNPSEMLESFRKLPGMSQNHYAWLKDTVGWSDPAHHTDPNWQVPESAAIEAHISRLHDLMKQLSLKT